MEVKKSMKEWGVTNELEMLREIIRSSPLLKAKVQRKLDAFREKKALENLAEKSPTSGQGETPEEKS